MEVGLEDDPPDGGGTWTEVRGSKRPADVLSSQDASLSISKKQAINSLTSSPSEPESIPMQSEVQSVYHAPGFEADSKLKYSSNEEAPFIVYVSRVEPDPSAGFTIRLLKFAQFLHINKVEGIKSGGLSLVGRNRISVEFSNLDLANNFLANPLLTANKYEAIIPRFHITRMGVVRDVPTEWTLEDFVNNIDTPTNCGPVISARRLNRKVKKPDLPITWSPTTTVVLTFRGQALPERIFCYHSSLPVSVYYLPTIQCRNCCKFGHIASQCRSKPRCFRCGQEHTGESCDSRSPLCCLFCEDSHLATSSSCPEHVRQREIKVIMANENLSYSEASQRIPQDKRSYSRVAATEAPPSQVPAYAQYYSPQSSPLRTSQVCPPSQPQSSTQKTSYKKTIFTTPKPRPDLGKMYDSQSHRDITSTPRSSQSNGCAYRPSEESTPLLTPNDNLIELLVCSLINIVSKFSDALPPTAISLLQKLLTSLITNNNGFGSASVEC